MEEARAASLPLLCTAVLQTAVLSCAVAHTRHNGWRLVGALFLVFYGAPTLMVAIEAVYLPEARPADIVLLLLIYPRTVLAVRAGHLLHCVDATLAAHVDTLGQDACLDRHPAFSAVLMGTNLLQAADLPVGLRIAHLVEVVEDPLAP